MNRIKELEDALSDLIDVASECDGWEEFPSYALDRAFRVWEKKRSKKYNDIDDFFEKNKNGWIFDGINWSTADYIELKIKRNVNVDGKILVEFKSFECFSSIEDSKNKLLDWANNEN